MNRIDVKDEIAFIKKVIEDSKRTIGGENMGSIVWGIIVVIGMLLTYLHIIILHFIPVVWVWIVLIGLGWIYTVYSTIKQKNKASVKTFGSRILTSLWTACGIVMTCIGFYATLTGFIKPWAIIPLCCMVIGIGYFVTADIADSRITKLFAFLWWIGGLLMMTWPGSYIFLIFALMIITMQIIPNIKYHLDWKKQVAGMVK